MHSLDRCHLSICKASSVLIDSALSSYVGTGAVCAMTEGGIGETHASRSEGVGSDSCTIGVIGAGRASGGSGIGLSQRSAHRGLPFNDRAMEVLSEL